eukprot:6466618-Amphidinium_carterae.1
MSFRHCTPQACTNQELRAMHVPDCLNGQKVLEQQSKKNKDVNDKNDKESTAGLRHAKSQKRAIQLNTLVASCALPRVKYGGMAVLTLKGWQSLKLKKGF